MSIQKPKAYRVVLDAEVGGHSTMIVAGCVDEDECIKFVNRAKQKGQTIHSIHEASARVAKFA